MAYGNVAVMGFEMFFITNEHCKDSQTIIASKLVKVFSFSISEVNSITSFCPVSIKVNQ
jgi:hypothetical protein